MHFAARFNHHDVVELLLHYSADINAQDHDGDRDEKPVLAVHALQLVHAAHEYTSCAIALDPGCPPQPCPGHPCSISASRLHSGLGTTIQGAHVARPATLRRPALRAIKYLIVSAATVPLKV